ARAHRVRPSDALVDGLEAELTGPAVASVDVDRGEHLVCSSLSHERPPSSVVGCGTLWVPLPPMTDCLPSLTVVLALLLRIVRWPAPLPVRLTVCPLPLPVAFHVEGPLAIGATALLAPRVVHGLGAVRARADAGGSPLPRLLPGGGELRLVPSVEEGAFVFHCGAAVG